MLRQIFSAVLYLAVSSTLLCAPLLSDASVESGDRVVKAAVLKNWPPHYTVDPSSGKPWGFAVDVFDEISRKAGISVRYIPFDTWPMVLDALEKGSVHVVPNMGVTPDRLRIFDFTPPVEAFDIHIFVRETTHDIHGLQDLENRRVGAVKRNIGLALIRDFGRSDLEIFDSLDRAFLALISGRLDALVYPEPIMLMTASQAGLENRIKTAGPPLLEVKRAIAVSKGQEALLKRLSLGVEAFVSTPAYQAIYKKYFRKPESYWNAGKIFLIMSILLVSTTVLLLFWRYLSMVRLNRTLAETVRLKTVAEEKLIKQQGFLAKAQEIGQIGTWELDLVNNEMTWTQENYRIFGLPQDTPLTYETFLTCVHPEDRDFVDTQWKASFDGKPYDIEHRILAEDRVKWVREKAELAFDEEGRCIRGVGVTQDITSRKLIETSLRVSENKFRMVFQSSPDAINLNRIEDGRYVEINRGFTQIMGYTSREVIGRTSRELNIWKNPEDREQLALDLKAHGFVDNLDAEFVAKGGEIKNGLMSASLLDLGDEKLIVSITRDVTDRKKTERELAKSEAWHRSIIQTAMDGFWVTDNSGNILEVNNTYCQMSGYTQDELLKMKISDLESAETREDTTAHIRLVKQQKEDRFQSRHRRKDGHLIDVEIQIQYRGDEDGLFVVFIKDITERTRWQEKLQQVQKMESIGNLAGGIAHDFNNILFPIIGMSEMLLEDLPSGSPEAENALEIYRAGRRGGELVKQILAFSRQSEHLMSPTRVQQILKEVLKLSRATIPATIDIRREIQPDCGLVLADPTQIHQVAMNIITNAYHAIGDSGGSITIRLREAHLEGADLVNTSLLPGRYAILSVSDTGCGIPVEQIEKIFDPYFTTKEQGKGTGLGLAVVHGIVKAHDGEILVTSTRGEGSTFTVYLPLMDTPSGNTRNPKEKEPPGGTETLLLVDDEPAVARLEKQILERLGYTVFMHTGSTDALEAFQTDPGSFDAVISDMTMPHMTGEELARKIRAIRSDIPVIICTGFSERINNSAMDRLGIDAVLMKPIIKTDLAEAVRKVLDGAGSPS